MYLGWCWMCSLKQMHLAQPSAAPTKRTIMDPCHRRMCSYSITLHFRTQEEHDWLGKRTSGHPPFPHIPTSCAHLGIDADLLCQGLKQQPQSLQISCAMQWSHGDWILWLLGERLSCFVLPLHPGSAEDASEDGDDALLSCGWSSRHAGGLSRAKVNHTILEWNEVAAVIAAMNCSYCGSYWE